MVYVSQIIVLYILNLHSAACQWYLHKTGRKKMNEEGKREILIDTEKNSGASILTFLRSQYIMVFHVFFQQREHLRSYGEVTWRR